MSRRMLMSFSGSIKKSDTLLDSWTPIERYTKYLAICESSGYRVISKSISLSEDWVDIMVVGERR